jgi:hypothetical protein
MFCLVVVTSVYAAKAGVKKKAVDKIIKIHSNIKGNVQVLCPSGWIDMKDEDPCPLVFAVNTEISAVHLRWGSVDEFMGPYFYAGYAINYPCTLKKAESLLKSMKKELYSEADLDSIPGQSGRGKVEQRSIKIKRNNGSFYQGIEKICYVDSPEGKLASCLIATVGDKTTKTETFDKGYVEHTTVYPVYFLEIHCFEHFWKKSPDIPKIISSFRVP